MGEKYFELGDVVVLKSNKDIPMTVDSLELNNRVKCIWFMGGNLNVKVFNVSSLEKYEEPAPKKELLS